MLKPELVTTGLSYCAGPVHGLPLCVFFGFQSILQRRTSRHGLNGCIRACPSERAEGTRRIRGRERKAGEGHDTGPALPRRPLKPLAHSRVLVQLREPLGTVLVRVG